MKCASRLPILHVEDINGLPCGSPCAVRARQTGRFSLTVKHLRLLPICIVRTDMKTDVLRSVLPSCGQSAVGSARSHYRYALTGARFSPVAYHPVTKDQTKIRPLVSFLQRLCFFCLIVMLLAYDR